MIDPDNRDNPCLIIYLVDHPIRTPPGGPESKRIALERMSNVSGIFEECAHHEPHDRRGGRPAMGSAPASVESVRLDPELSSALRGRAEEEGRTNSDLIRDALRRYIEGS